MVPALRHSLPLTPLFAGSSFFLLIVVLLRTYAPISTSHCWYVVFPGLSTPVPLPFTHTALLISHCFCFFSPPFFFLPSNFCGTNSFFKLFNFFGCTSHAPPLFFFFSPSPPLPVASVFFRGSPFSLKLCSSQTQLLSTSTARVMFCGFSCLSRSRSFLFFPRDSQLLSLTHFPITLAVPIVL